MVANFTVEPAALITLKIQTESSFETFAITDRTARCRNTEKNLNKKFHIH